MSRATDARLLTDADLLEITGMKRYSKQAAWFKRAFGVDVVTGGRGRPIVTWSTYEALCAKRAGLAPVGETPAGNVELCFD